MRGKLPAGLRPPRNHHLEIHTEVPLSQATRKIVFRIIAAALSQNPSRRSAGCNNRYRVYDTARFLFIEINRKLVSTTAKKLPRGSGEIIVKSIRHESEKFRRDRKDASIGIVNHL